MATILPRSIVMRKTTRGRPPGAHTSPAAPFTSAGFLKRAKKRSGRPRHKHLVAGSRKRLFGGAGRITLHDMKTSALTIRLDPELQRQLNRVAKRTGRSRSDLVREALRRQLALAQLDDLRRRIMPLAEARGYLTDEDVFRDVS